MSKLTIKNLCKSFGDKQILKNYSVEIEAGQIVWLKADSGAGKTTLFRIIAGLEKADSGEVSFDGDIIYCFQEDRLIDELNAVENILAVLSGEAVKKPVKGKTVDSIKSHLAELGLSGEDIIKPVVKLSGGMKRRVALARAVCYMMMNKEGDGNDSKSAKLLLLDEPFTGLDDANKSRAFEYVKKHIELQQNNVITLIASHEIVE